MAALQGFQKAWSVWTAGQTAVTDALRWTLVEEGVIHADPSAHPRRNGRLQVDMKPLPLGRCSRRVHSVRLRRLKDLANAFGHASEARRRRFALPGPLFPKWQLPAQKRPCRVWTAVRGDRWPHC